MSTLAGLLPVVLLIAFVAWVLWRRRALESSGSLDQFELEASSTEPPARWSTESPARWSTESREASSTESIELPPAASVVVTPVRWEPPVRSAGPALPGPAQPSASPSGGSQDEVPLDGPRRGRIEDLLERARLEDEGAA